MPRKKLMQMWRMMERRKKVADDRSLATEFLRRTVYGSPDFAVRAGPRLTSEDSIA